MDSKRSLYRSKSEAAIGGVAAGFGNYFGVDPILLRIGFVVATIFTGGAFIAAYLAMWLLIPTAGSTASETSQVVQENLNEMGEKVRGFTGMGGAVSPAGGQPNTVGNGGNGGNGAPNGNGAASTQISASTQPRQGVGPMLLIVLGTVFLLANMGVFRAIHWGLWWPLLLIGLGVIMVTRRR